MTDLDEQLEYAPAGKQCDAFIHLDAVRGTIRCHRHTNHQGAHKALTAIHRNGAEEHVRWA